jgi:hypothetical protein
MQDIQNRLQDLAAELLNAQDLTKKAIIFGMTNGSSVEYDSLNQKLTESLVKTNAIAEQIKDAGYLLGLNEYKIINIYHDLNKRLAHE